MQENGWKRACDMASGRARAVFSILGHTPSNLGRRLLCDADATSLGTKNFNELAHYYSTNRLIAVVVAASRCRQEARERWRLPFSNLGHLVYCEIGRLIRGSAVQTFVWPSSIVQTSRGPLRSLLRVVLPRLTARWTSSRKNVDMWRVRYPSHD